MAFCAAVRLQPRRKALALYCLARSGYETYFSTSASAADCAEVPSL
jgi:hypothetical protein